MEQHVDTLSDLTRSAVAIPGVVSAAIFLQLDESDGLRLMAASGIDGEPLRQLSAAVLNPAHPIARTVVDATASFDVSPTAPGGPALRSHLPILVDRGETPECAGVLAVAHDPELDESARAALGDLANRAGRLASVPADDARVSGA